MLVIGNLNDRAAIKLALHPIVLAIIGDCQQLVGKMLRLGFPRLRVFCGERLVFPNPIGDQRGISKPYSPHALGEGVPFGN